MEKERETDAAFARRTSSARERKSGEVVHVRDGDGNSATTAGEQNEEIRGTGEGKGE